MKQQIIPAHPGEISAPASAYLQVALTILQTHSLHRATIDWPALFAATWPLARGAQEPVDTYPAIEFALRQLNDGHSFFQRPETVQAIESGAQDSRNRLPTGRLLTPGIAYLHVPDFMGSTAAVQAYCGDPAVVHFMTFGPNTVAETQSWLQWCMEQSQAALRSIYSLAVVLKSDGQLIGNCTLALDPAEPCQAAFSYLLNRAYWGQGYATEAMHALFTFGFNELGLHRVADAVDPANVASIRVLEKLGLRREGHLREVRWHKGHWWDEYLYAILMHEWQAQRNHNAATTGVKHGAG